MAVAWKNYNIYDEVNDKYLPPQGEGDSLATQIVTAINKLVYRYYNDGDVYDNTGWLDGYEDISSYANWLRTQLPFDVGFIMDRVFDCSKSEYEDLLWDLTELCLDSSLLDWAASQPKKGSVYDCDGPYAIVEYEDDDEEYDEDDDDDFPELAEE